jgi:hypothetical protein
VLEEILMIREINIEEKVVNGRYRLERLGIKVVSRSE